MEGEQAQARLKSHPDLPNLIIRGLFPIRPLQRPLPSPPAARLPRLVSSRKSAIFRSLSVPISVEWPRGPKSAPHGHTFRRRERLRTEEIGDSACYLYPPCPQSSQVTVRPCSGNLASRSTDRSSRFRRGRSGGRPSARGRKQIACRRYCRPGLARECSGHAANLRPILRQL